MSETSGGPGGGIGFLGLLTIVFITLKLTDHIAWSWWWVFAPAWGPVALLVAVASVALPIAAFVKQQRNRPSARRRGQ